MKRSPLLRESPLKRGGLAAPTIPANPPAKRSTLRPVSKKRQAVNAHRAKVVAHIREFQDWCSRCLQTGIGLDAHELIRRSQWRAGLIDPENISLLCRPCHSWVTENPKAAHEEGWVRWSWER